MTVVKVGGSLYDHPALGPGLRAYLAALPAPVLVVPGGGPFADAVRALDATHRLGDEAAHWLAIDSLALAARFLRHLVPGIDILDVRAFCAAHDALPHTWDVTTDSIAAHAAGVYKAARLVLLKSVAVPPGTPWGDAAARGWVDPHFPAIVAPHGLTVEAVDFRAWLDRPTIT